MIAADPAFTTVVAEHTAQLHKVAPYRPGAFFTRELPALRTVLSKAHPAEFAVPVIGVTKSAFLGASHALQVRRGHARRPLYVTALGIPPEDAAALVQRMPGHTGCLTPYGEPTPCRAPTATPPAPNATGTDRLVCPDWIGHGHRQPCPQAQPGFHHHHGHPQELSSR